MGDCLAIYPRNHRSAVDEFCAMYGLDPEEELRIVALPDARNKVISLPYQGNPLASPSRIEWRP